MMICWSYLVYNNFPAQPADKCPKSRPGVCFPKASLANYGRKFRRYQHSSMIQCFPKP